MVDTIVLILPKDKFQILDPDKFQPSARFLLNNNSNYKSVQNPTKKNLRACIYRPILTLQNKVNKFGNFDLTLKIELSLPKLFFGNNFEELRYKNFPDLCHKLIDNLNVMGISINFENIINAQIYGIHYSKNILLTDGSTPYHYINKIKEANVKLSLDVNQTNYRNEGHSFKWHCNSYEVVFYDKIKDLEKAKQSSKRAIEKNSEMQINLLDELRPKTLRHARGRRKLEILRMEVRFNRRKKIKHIFDKLNIKSDLTFKKLFKPSISKKVLLHYLDELENKRPNLIDHRFTSDKALLTDLIFNNPKMSIKKTLQFVGLKKLLDTINIRELRNIFANHNRRTWERLIAESNKLKLSSNQKSFEKLRDSINQFKALALKL